MLSAFKYFGHQGDLSDFELGSLAPASAYVTEVGSKYYVTEDGTKFYVPESLVVPAPAALAGYTKSKLFSPFPNTNNIDVNDTRKPGFEWYVNQSIPYYNLFDAVLSPAKDIPSTPSSALTVSGGILTLDHSVKFAAGINTIITGRSQNTFTGTTFGGGWYAEISAAFDPAASRAVDQSFGGWPFFGSLTSGVTAGATNGVEIDILEAYPISDGNVSMIMTVHDYPTGAAQNTNGGVNNAVTLSGNLNTQNTYGALWWPSNKVGTPTVSLIGPTASTFTDILGNTWGLGAPAGGGQYFIVFNGTQTGGEADSIYQFLGAPWIHTSSGWFSYNGSGYTAQQATPFNSASSSGGIGIIMRFFNRVWIPSADVTYGAGYYPVPGLVPTSSIGALTELDSSPSDFGISAGPPSSFSGVAWPLKVANVQVWGSPSRRP